MSNSLRSVAFLAATAIGLLIANGGAARADQRSGDKPPTLDQLQIALQQLDSDVRSVRGQFTTMGQRTKPAAPDPRNGAKRILKAEFTWSENRDWSAVSLDELNHVEGVAIDRSQMIRLRDDYWRMKYAGGHDLTDVQRRVYDPAQAAINAYDTASAIGLANSEASTFEIGWWKRM